MVGSVFESPMSPIKLRGLFLYKIILTLDF